MKRRPHNTGPKAGISLLETVLGLTLFGIFLSTAAVAVSDGRATFKNTSRTNELENRVSRALDRVALELVSAGSDELDPDPVSDVPVTDFLFRQAVSLTGTSINWGPQKQLLLEEERMDPTDGVDNGGDGIVDEMQLVLLRGVGTGSETRIVLCRGVRALMEGEEPNGVDDNGDGLRDEAGFSLLRTGDVLALALCVEDTNGAGGTLTRTLRTSIRLRN